MPIPASNSSKAGYLPPTNTQVEDNDFEDLLQKLVVGVTGMRGNVVFPRWQPEPPNYPAFGTDWAAIGMTGRTADTFPYQKHYPSNNGDGGHSLVIRHEEINVMVSFYGPHSENNAAVFREGVFVDQNRAILRANNMELVEVGDIIHAPELTRMRFLKRVDMQVVFRRQVIRSYAILDLLEAEASVISNVGYTTNAVTPPIDDVVKTSPSSTE